MGNASFVLRVVLHLLSEKIDRHFRVVVGSEITIYNSIAIFKIHATTWRLSFYDLFRHGFAVPPSPKGEGFWATLR
jgi:hypothetical protein